ncbi:MAG: DUF1667 domain-containing protein [Faecalibacterium sp.]|nr:DUF1667 domain-containing protein [Ruminococcus sp.]MCM1392953.1 DUF1667 domain-containing protein [Ruminococcus sp.]MCM1485306.1 DUF1667 domain-containing protein [Faecalibacterium sp.]
MIKEMICVSCPLGCPIKVELSESGEVLSVTDNTCKRGEQYAISECTNPVRILTSTMKVNGGSLPVIPVKTSAPIPKDMMFECMKVINNEVVDAPIKMGDVLISNVCDTGVDIVATNEV